MDEKIDLKQKSGLAIIVANDYKTFTSYKRPLDGPLQDANKAQATFESLNAECVTVINASAAELIAKCSSLGSRPHPKKFKWIVFVFSGHGENDDMIVAQDGVNVRVQELVNLFQSQPSLIPKIFLFDACRGNETTNTVIVPRGSVDTNNGMVERGGKPLNTLKLPEYCNILVAFSTLPRKKAYEFKGGLWLSQLLDRLATQNSSVTDILNEVNSDVISFYQDMEGFMQQPQYTSTLLGNVFFTQANDDSVEPAVQTTTTKMCQKLTSRSDCYTKELNDLCKAKAITRKYTDHPAQNQSDLVITLSNGNSFSFQSSSVGSHDCINDAREAAAKLAIDFISPLATRNPEVAKTPSVSPPTNASPKASAKEKPAKLFVKEKEYVQELKNIVVDKKGLEHPNYETIEECGNKFRCTVKHKLFTETGEWCDSKKAAKQSAAKKALKKIGTI